MTRITSNTMKRNPNITCRNLLKGDSSHQEPCLPQSLWVRHTFADMDEIHSQGCTCGVCKPSIVGEFSQGICRGMWLPFPFHLPGPSCEGVNPIIALIPCCCSSYTIWSIYYYNDECSIYRENKVILHEMICPLNNQ